MAVKIALVVELFIVICVAPGLKSSQVVPDGLIYTEVQKTVVRGVEAVLTCRFYGDPLTVYWRKGLDPDDLSLIVAWNGGRVSGPRYDDGSCDVDENYSLIIKNVSTADSGRMYCTVSNNKGPPMTNYTDIVVLDTAITTNPQATLQLRQATYGILLCTVHIKARRVSWKKGTTSSGNESLVVIENNQGSAERSGAGYEEGTYNITHDYSLVIKELQIHHGGLYVCQVTDDTGISFRNQTFVNVFAQPLEPFPTIQECLYAEPHDSNYCTLVAKSRMTLTCQAVKYYPSLNLVFLYGSKALEPSDTREWNNTDGTKNKTITIVTGDKKELYTCVAYNTIGTNVHKSTSVLLHGDEPVKSTLVIIIVCCLVVALALIPSVAYFIWIKKHRSNITNPPANYSSVPQNAPPQASEGSNITNPPANYSSVPQSAPPQASEGRKYTSLPRSSSVSVPRSHQHQKPKGIYSSLPPRRSSYDPGSDQSQELNDVDVQDLSQEEVQMLEQRVNTVLMNRYRRFYDATETNGFHDVNIICGNETALFDTHQMVIDWQQRQISTRSQYTRAYQYTLTVADESGSYSSIQPVSCTSVPGSHQHQEDIKVKDLTKEKFQALEQGTNEVLIKPNVRIHAIETKPFQAEKVINKSTTGIFDTHRMLYDWQQRATSAYHQYMRAFHATFSGADKSGPASNHAWPTNEELKIFSRHLTQESMKEICKELGLHFSYSYDDDKDEGNKLDSLCERRNNASDKSLEETFSRLSSFLESNNIGGLLPTLKGTYIYKAELVDLAFHLLIHDLLPIAKALGISVTKLASYRTAFDPSHLTINPIKLLIELLASTVEEDTFKRSTFFSTKITKLYCQGVARRGVFGYDMSYGELCSISEAIINQNTEGSADQDATSSMLPGPRTPKKLGNLQDVLQLTDQDIADRLDTSHPSTSFELFKIWKEKPRPSDFNCRAVLAHELRRIHMPSLADEVAAGKHMKERTSLAFIEDMVRGLNQDKLGCLGRLLDLSGTDEHWHTNTPLDMISKQVYDWVAKWTPAMEIWRKVSDTQGVTTDGANVVAGGTLLTHIKKSIPQEHRDRNDELVEHGFLDLAREIMIIEQRIAR